jgi:hypothetical protein
LAGEDLDPFALGLFSLEAEALGRDLAAALLAGGTLVGVFLVAALDGGGDSGDKIVAAPVFGSSGAKPLSLNNDPALAKAAPSKVGSGVTGALVGGLGRATCLVGG